MGIKIVSSGANSGDIKPHAGNVIPAGWLECGGQAVSRSTYQALFLAIGVLYGSGDGVNTFNLPDLRGRALFGKDNMGGTPANRITTGVGGLDGATLGAVGGSEGVTLTTAQSPAHFHIEGMATNSGGDSGRYGLTDTGVGATRYSLTAGPDGRSPNTSTVGSGNAHQNIPPAMVVNYIIKT